MRYDGLISYLQATLKEEPGTYIVKLEYSRVHEHFGAYDIHKSYEVMDISPDGDICWFNDWWEGEEYCSCEGVISLDELIDGYYKLLKIKGLDGWPEDCWDQAIKIMEGK